MERLLWPGVFGIVVGVGMVGQWAVSLAAGSVPEVDTRPVALGFHLAAEGLTAVLLICAGAGLVRGARWARSLYLLAVGMLLYTAIVSPGYFVQEGQPGFALLFIVILVLAAVCLVAVVRDGSRTGSDAD
jgi:peptidoglycan/LPS O-acetylase OafA/YrhL